MCLPTTRRCVMIQSASPRNFTSWDCCRNTPVCCLPHLPGTVYLTTPARYSVSYHTCQVQCILPHLPGTVYLTTPARYSVSYHTCQVQCILPHLPGTVYLTTPARYSVSYHTCQVQCILLRTPVHIVSSTIIRHFPEPLPTNLGMLCCSN